MEFKPHGNIFKDEEILAMIPELATNDVRNLQRRRTSYDRPKSILA
jgi:hypothetical protein